MSGEILLLCLSFVQSMFSPNMSAGYERKLLAGFSQRVQVCEKVAHASVASGHDWELMVSLSFEESRFFESDVSSAGAKGPMQVLPQFFCPKKGKCNYIQAGLRAWDRWLTRSPKGPKQVSTALCHYNSGNVCTGGGRRYARRVLRRLRRMRARAAWMKTQVTSVWCIEKSSGSVFHRSDAAKLGGCVEVSFSK